MITERQRDERDLRIIDTFCEGIGLLRLKIAAQEGISLDLVDTILAEQGMMQTEEGE